MGNRKSRDLKGETADQWKKWIAGSRWVKTTDQCKKWIAGSKVQSPSWGRGGSSLKTTRIKKINFY